ncbi:hypothetical protein [Marinifilum fragile]|uniref:hypothetical protein n=1 Tax=Marinifilum fragile TaxID=570161 RepID=UPI0006D01143|nr:hypothetical protein [Marinifilum fragile]
MDTIIVNNQIYPLKLDSIKVNSDFTMIVNELDSLRLQSKEDFKELNNTIQIAHQKDNYFDNVSNDALFTTITTILVFSLGVFINILIKWIERLRNKKSIRVFVKQHLDKIIDSFSTNLQGAYSKIANGTTIDTGITLTPPKILSNDFQRILHLDSKELFSSIKKKKELSNVVSQIDFLSNLIPEVQEYHANALAGSNKFRDKLNTDLNKYMDALADFVDFEKENTKDYENTEPYKTINDSIIKFYNEISGKRELQKFYDEILRPNQEYLVKSNLFRTHEIGKLIANLGKDLSHLFNDLLNLTTEFKDQYSEFSGLIKDSTTSLKDNMDKINWR